MIPRCPHGIYSEDGDGLPSKYCSGCFSPYDPLVPQPAGAVRTRTDVVDEGEITIDNEPQEEVSEEFQAFPFDTDDCPTCGEKLTVNPEDEFDISCAHCGFEV